MRPRPSQVAENLRVGTAGRRQHVGHDGEAGGVQVAAGQVALLVHGLRQRDDRAAVSGRLGGVNGHGAERERAEDVAEQESLRGPLSIGGTGFDVHGLGSTDRQGVGRGRCANNVMEERQGDGVRPPRPG